MKMKKNDRHTFTEMVDLYENNKFGVILASFKYSTTVISHGILLLSMATAEGYDSPVDYANAKTGSTYTLPQVLHHVKAAESLRMGILDVDMFGWIAYYAQYVEDHEGTFHQKSFWKQMRRLTQSICKLMKAAFVARREEK